MVFKSLYLNNPMLQTLDISNFDYLIKQKSKFEISKVCNIGLLRYRDLKTIVCSKDSISLHLQEHEQNVYKCTAYFKFEKEIIYLFLFSSLILFILFTATASLFSLLLPSTARRASSTRRAGPTRLSRALASRTLRFRFLIRLFK